MSEFRQDPVSGDWVIIAPGRAARPQFLEIKKKARKPSPVATCPFDDLEKSGNWPPLAATPSKEKWRVAVIPNKYPALSPATLSGHGDACSTPFRHGFYRAMTGIGRHELVIARDHAKNFAALDRRAAAEVFRAIQARVRAAAKDPCINYVSIFFNWGPLAGASVWHPHYQILALPIVPAHSAGSLAGAKAYFKKNRRCVRCDILKAEAKEGTRIIAENGNAVAFAPYASKIPLEVRVMPKRHFPYFHKTPDAVLRDVSFLLQTVLKDMKSRANDPDLNFYIHEAPVDGRNNDYHHWHVEVLPRVSTPAGFEFSTAIYINVIDPDRAAAILRGKKISK